jgi:hypothetical protein
MSEQCIHGFTTEQCAACRECRHGLMTSRCARCHLDAGRQFARQPQAPLEYEGYEIFFVAKQNSWYYRALDASPSADSFGSAFLARRAIDRLRSSPAATPPRKRSR